MATPGAVKAGRAYIEYYADDKRLNKQNKSIEKNVKSMASNMKLAFASIGVGVGVRGVFNQFNDATQAAVLFSKKMAEVNTLMRLSKADFAKLKTEVRELSVELGSDLITTVDALYDSISAGVPRENVMEFLKVSGKLAIAGASDIATAVDGVTSALNSYDRPASDAIKVADIFFKTVEKGKIRLLDLTTAIGTVTPLANKMNLSLEEVAGAMATLTKGGLTTSEAATQVSAVMTAFLQNGAMIDAQLQKIAKTENIVSVSTLKFQQKLQLLFKSVKGNNAAIKEMFSRKEALKGMLGLTGDKAASAAKDLWEMENAMGAANTGFAIMADEGDMKIRRLSATINDLKISLGDLIAPSVAEAAENIMAILRISAEIEKAKKEGVGGLYTSEAYQTVSSIVEAMAKINLPLRALGITSDDVLAKLDALGLKLININREGRQLLEIGATDPKTVAIDTFINEIDAWEKKEKEAADKMLKRKAAADQIAYDEQQKTEKVNKSVDKQVKGLEKAAAAQAYKNEGLEREWFIRQEINKAMEAARKAGVKLTEEQRKRIQGAAAETFDIKQKKQAAEFKMISSGGTFDASLTSAFRAIQTKSKDEQIAANTKDAARSASEIKRDTDIIKREMQRGTAQTFK